MKKYLNLTTVFAAMAAMLMFTACSVDEEQGDNGKFVPTPVKFTAGLNDAAVRITRAYNWEGTTPLWSGTSIVGTWDYDATTAANADKVMLFSVDDTGGAAATAIKGYEYFVSDNSNGLTATDAANNKQFYFMKANETKKVIAWSFGSNTTLLPANFDLDASHKMSYTVDQDQSTSGWNKELLWGYGLITNFAPINVDIPMYHQLARVDIQVRADDAMNAATEVYIGKKDATKTLASEEFLALQGDFTPLLDHKNNTYDITTAYNSTGPVIGAWPTAAPSDHYGAWVAETAASKQYITPHKSAYTDPVAASTQGDHITQYSAVVIPQTHTASTFILFEIVVDGIRYVYVPTTAVTWAAGNQYNYDITVSSSGISVTATIQAWSSGGNTDGSAELD